MADPSTPELTEVVQAHDGAPAVQITLGPTASHESCRIRVGGVDLASSGMVTEAVLTVAPLQVSKVQAALDAAHVSLRVDAAGVLHVLRRYLVHLPGCRWHADVGDACSCGLGAALALLGVEAHAE